MQKAIIISNGKLITEGSLMRGRIQAGAAGMWRARRGGNEAKTRVGEALKR